MLENYSHPRGATWMPFNNIVDPEQLAVLSAVLNEICLAAGIEPESTESGDAAGLLTHLHGFAVALPTS